MSRPGPDKGKPEQGALPCGRKENAQGKLRAQPAAGGPERIDLTEMKHEGYTNRLAASVIEGQMGRQSQLQPNGTQPPGGGPSGAGLAQQADRPML